MKKENTATGVTYPILPKNLLDYTGTPASDFDKDLLMFSDQGAWFGYSIPENAEQQGFSGPFLMTQDNGIWSSPAMVQLELLQEEVPVKFTSHNSLSSLGFLEFNQATNELEVTQQLFYSDSNTAAIKIEITNTSGSPQKFVPVLKGQLSPESLSFEQKENNIRMNTSVNDSFGILNFPENKSANSEVAENSFRLLYPPVDLASGSSFEFVYTQSFFFPAEESEVSLQQKLKAAGELQRSYSEEFEGRNLEKQQILNSLSLKLEENWRGEEYRDLLAKLILTLQNNWRSPAGNLKHAGLFPSYHYKWFHGFWAWDSWKHAAALAAYDPQLAKDQVKAMYDHLDENGFMPDVVYRDNLIEENNYRDTKPPLSAWAVWKIYETDADKEFLIELFPKLEKQHQWWYTDRDHDKDGLAEYGSTDGTLIAAKWESGMDNGVRFDRSKLLKNGEKAYSLDQESVDLNAYLYAEKLYLAKIAAVLELDNKIGEYENLAAALKTKIQNQFFDTKTGWFYDTSLDGNEFIKVRGSEGWIALFTEVASQEQAAHMKETMMDPQHFNLKVPLQTLDATHPAFEPDGGYWRGPNWLDQAYFGLMGLRNYGYETEANELAYKLLHQAEGVLKSGKSIRENYNPVTGEGLEAQNFSWSAAHLLMLLTNE
ncbi:MGH1-like glycoside hydrolase domain-containing protein [Salinimicrobium sediminilitoris]|uniref:MGH1-like glycoside hydrolase domain-containing protein n=1 Tax=Salinimicrobium sediminilitoris TaxID=2876715 RepID=UPI001E60344A|nr:trehalase [Salinimicrobium sediminilitoris]